LTNGSDLSWRKKVLEILQYYTDRTPGSMIEEKEIGVAWHFAQTDLKFGEWQSAECQNHMTNSLPNYPIHILRRKKCIEVYLRNVSKATGIRRILQHHQHRARRLSIQQDREQMATSCSFESAIFSISDASPMNDELFDFIFCVGDDRSDEYMFEFLHKLVMKRSSIRERNYSHHSNYSDTTTCHLSESVPPDFSPLSTPRSLNSISIYTCTVGAKSSAAKYYIPSIGDALHGLEYLAQL
jgi:trehalose-phosphatase